MLAYWFIAHSIHVCNIAWIYANSIFSPQKAFIDPCMTLINKNWHAMKHKAPTKRSQHCWVQLVACVWPPCCDMLRHVATCWVFPTFMDVACCCGRLARFVQQCCTWACDQSQHVATGWPKACNMLRPTMLRTVVFKCCDRLAGDCKCWANNVGICCVEMLLSFGRGLS